MAQPAPPAPLYIKQFNSYRVEESRVGFLLPEKVALIAKSKHGWEYGTTDPPSKQKKIFFLLHFIIPC